jgi:hypothetical protein
MVTNEECLRLLYRDAKKAVGINIASSRLPCFRRRSETLWRHPAPCAHMAIFGGYPPGSEPSNQGKSKVGDAGGSVTINQNIHLQDTLMTGVTKHRITTYIF